MKSIILVKGNEFLRLKRGPGTTEKQFNFLVENATVFGYHGFYADEKSGFNYCFPNVDFDKIPTEEIANIPFQDSGAN